VPLPTAARAIPHELSLEHCQDPLAGQLPNTDSIEATLMKHQFCWVGHVIRMPDTQLPKRILCGQLPGGGHSQLTWGPATALHGRAET